MEIHRLVTAARLGDNDAFGGLVRLYQKRLLGAVRSIVVDEHEAEDVVQEAFLRAWSSLGSLRRPEAFSGWLWTMARNIALSHCRARQKNPSECREGMDEVADPRSELDEGEVPGWEHWSPGLTPAQKQLVVLRHGAGLSLRQIGLVLGVPEQRVKSRLFTLRRRLARILAAPVPDGPSMLLEEKIMTKIEALQLGAHVFERLSLVAQVEFARGVLASRSVSEAVLAEIGRVDRGSAFLELYGLLPTLKEFVGFLNYVDRFTESRVVEAMEVLCPAEAETLKRNFFVLEDLVLFDRAALLLLVQTCDSDLLAVAMAGLEASAREHFLQAFGPDDQTRWRANLGHADGDRKVVRAAQELVVHTIKDLEQAGRLVVRRPPGQPEGIPLITVG